MAFSIPSRLAASCAHRPERATWLADLPNAIDGIATRWRLRLGAPFDSEDVSCAWVAPAWLPDGTPAVLKLGMPHMEGAHELAGLRFWNGDAMVRLLDADETLNAMLLERCIPATPLRSLPEPDQDVVVARLLRRLWRKPPVSPAFRPLSAMLDYWSRETLAGEPRWTDAELVREGLRLFEELPRTARSSALLATDLHAGNVLRAEREEWLAIDPKPFIGDKAYDVTQHLLNCRERLRADPFGVIDRVASLAGVDAGRVRLWTFARLAAEPRDEWAAEAGTLARRLAP